MHLSATVRERIERIATKAADLGDTVMTDLCDDALAGTTSPDVVFAAVMDDLQYWPAEGVTRLLIDLGLKVPS